MRWTNWKANKQQLLILLCIGVLLIVIGIPTNNNTQTVRKNDDLESRLENILSQIEGIGEVHVMITRNRDETVQGIAVAAQKGDSPIVANEITEVIKALFQIETHKIKVIKGGS